MALIIILNAVFAVFVVGGILILLGLGIASDRMAVAKLAERHRAASRSRRRQRAPRFEPAYTRGS